ncbi:MATE family efflux transporter [Mycobacterium intracellulare]|uniref:Probable multidrug resistance protein NorM n=1 Tax=Mycobacterium intracellulare subsp. chimaera TaxID=222805 RepID=A0ABT7PAQ4_MYCIT|nr:MATE family efflux transporter [Mycobacterium intracellulare]AOS92147.1 MATE family efflux transporter [Mycobacterium intracellulare subsp. chimaera]ASL09491.1 Na(+)/drug antiporter [Mycobacterium intracellulare subsp. chimaera]ASL21296.1 Na(+)/drug antiporter [Mycobacterium intracellulare subsp. chimaera]KPN44985.1 MATE family efflux transporter [Mycobacterium intracellulare subsp. chimaera]KPN45451.1 MATE family efflux transporter [Mycobacterium intracellulare subsp. chimaera]
MDETSGTRLASLVRTSRQLTTLAAPIAGVQFAQVALTTTDLAVMGLIGVQAIAAGGLAAALYNLMRTMCVGVVTAVGNLVAGAAGRGEARSGGDRPDDQAQNEIRQITRSAVLVATAAAVLLGVALIGLGYVLPLFGLDKDVVRLARPMMIALAPGLIPMVWLNVLRQFSVGMRRPGPLLAVSIASIALNAALDLVFIYGLLGIPKLGLAGIGLATTLVQVITVAAFYAVLRHDDHLAPLLSIDGWKADAPTARSIVRLGIPISLTYGSEAGITSLAAVVMGAFGPIALAAHNVVTQLTRIAFQVSIGLSHGASILISRAVGRVDKEHAQQIATAALVLGWLTTALIGLVYVAAPSAVLRPFLDPADSSTIVLAKLFLLFAIVQQIVDFTQNIAVGLLRGIENTAAGLRATSIGYWVVGLPAMLLLAFPAHLRGPGVWIGLSTGFAMTAVLLLRRFYRDLPRMV